MTDNKIIIRWMSEIDKYLLLIFTNREVFFVKNENGCVIEKLNPEVHMNRTVWRIPGTSRRITKKAIRDNSERVEGLV